MKIDIMSYTSSSIKVLKGLEACRHRPGMYIGNIEEGVFQLFKEVIDNCIDEFLANHCNEINITFYKDGYASIIDNGRGIPVDIHEEEGISAAIVIMTQLHAGGKFDQESYKVSGGLHGVGVSVVNALSNRLELTVYRDGFEYFVAFEKGLVVEDLKVVGPSKKRGTKVKFIPDDTILPNQTFDLNVIKNRVEELAYLNPGLKIILNDERIDFKQEFFEPEGMISFVKKMVKNKECLHDLISIKKNSGNVVINCTMVWTKSYSEEVRSFTNNIFQLEGGTHVVGFKSAVSRVVTKYIEKDAALQKRTKDVQILSEDIREGVFGVLSIYFPEPQFSSQTKEKLVSSHIRAIVEGAIFEALETWFEENPNNAKDIIQKITNAAAAREAARKSRDLIRKNKDLNEIGLHMASKFSNCSEKDPAKKELFLVEGDSAGGSARKMRDRTNQAVLSLRGKILNVEKSNLEKMLNDESIRNLIAVLGTNIGENFDLTKLRFHKIIIMTDADVDGSHILVLLVTFFFRYMRPIIENGYLYASMPPLYGVKQGNKITYLRDDAELAEFFFKRNLDSIRFFDKENNLIAENILSTFFKDLAVVGKDLSFKHSLFQAALMCKIENEEEFNIEKLIESVKKIKDGKWVYEDEKFVYEKNGLTDYFKFNFSMIPENYIRFIKNWKNFWSGDIKMQYKGIEPKTFENPYEIYQIFSNKGKQDLTISRYKGLGEMDAEDVKTTAMANYQPIVYHNEAEAQELISTIMGEDVLPRKDFIDSIGAELETDD